MTERTTPPIFSLVPLLLATPIVIAAIVLWHAMPTRQQRPEIGTIFSTTPLPRLHASFEQSDPVSWGAVPQRGDLTLVHVWASWCSTCRFEWPVLRQLARHPHLHVIGVARNDWQSSLQTLLQREGNPFETLLLDPQGQFSKSQHIEGIPTTYLLDYQQRILAVFEGPIYQASTIEAYLNLPGI